MPFRYGGGVAGLKVKRHVEIVQGRVAIKTLAGRFKSTMHSIETVKFHINLGGRVAGWR